MDLVDRIQEFLAEAKMKDIKDLVALTVQRENPEFRRASKISIKPSKVSPQWQSEKLFDVVVKLDGRDYKYLAIYDTEKNSVSAKRN